MSLNIRIKKGLDIKLLGEADKVTKEVNPSKLYALTMSDFHGVTPKLIVKPGEKVLAGQAVFHDKTKPSVTFPSPVSGEVLEVERGAKRKILRIIIAADQERVYAEVEPLDLKNASSDQVKEFLLQNGAWPFIKQRPYAIIANPEDTPRDIYISAYDSKPLAPDYDYTLKGKETELQTAIDALGKLTKGKIYLGKSKVSTVSPFNNLNNVETLILDGPHPVGNISTQINKTNPLNKGEVVWSVNPADLVILGELILTGKFNMERKVALTGYGFTKPYYKKVIACAAMKDIIADESEIEGNRIIDGNVLNGRTSGIDGYLGYYTTQITAIEEGDDYDFFGWNRPRPQKYSFYRAFMTSFLTPNKKYRLNTNTNGEHRAFVLTGEFEKVFPLNIYPMQLIKSCMYQDIDEMEQLGIYEVAPEDFALTEFIDPSKNNHQQIIREGLDLMIKELG